MNQKTNRTESRSVATAPHGCLSPEKLSAQLDGEYVFSPEEEQHLAECRRCSDYYRSCKILNEKLSAALDVDCPGNALERIRKSVADQTWKREKQQKRIIPFGKIVNVFLRTAATVLLVGCVSAILLRDTPTGEDILAFLSFSPETKQDKIVIYPPISNSSATLSVAPEPYKSFNKGGIDIRQTRPVAAGEMLPIEFMGRKQSEKPEMVALIQPQVKHVWLTASGMDPVTLEKDFREILNSLSIPLNNVKLSVTPEGTLRVNAEMNRYQLVLLVRSLAARGLQLVSGVQPQPEQKLFSGSGREISEYEAVLMPGGK